MLKSSLCDYSDAYILVSGTKTVDGGGADDASTAADRNNKQVIFKNCVSFTNCITEINNTQIDSAKYLDFVMAMYNSVEYRENYSKKSRSLYQFGSDEPNNVITESESFKFKSKFFDNTNNAGIIINVKIVVPIQQFTNFWRTLEMSLINCEINLTLNWLANCVIS